MALSETKKYEGLIAGPAVAGVVRAEMAVPQMQGEYCGAATGYVRFTLNSGHVGAASLSVTVKSGSA